MNLRQSSRTAVISRSRLRAFLNRYPAGRFPLSFALVVLALLCLSVKQLAAVTKADCDARLVSAALKIFPDSIFETQPTVAYRMTVARNEYGPFQVAVSAQKAVRKVAVSVGALTGEKGSIQVPHKSLLLVENVPIERPSIPMRNSAAGKSPPQLWPDPLPPLSAFPVEAGKTRAAWVDLFIPADTPPGLYRGSVTVSADSVRVDLPLEVDVRSVVVPVKPSMRTAVGNGSLTACLEKAHNVTKGSPEFQKLLEKYYWFLVEHRLSPYHIPVDIYSNEAQRFLDDPRVSSFVVPLGAGAGEQGLLWDNKGMKRLNDRLEQTGWIEKGVFYVIDEPSPEAIPEVIRLGQRIHGINPRFRYLMTPHSGALLLDQAVLEKAGIDVWVPLLTVMSSKAERKILLKEQRQGKELWWYSCIVPKWKGMTYFIDEAATAPRLHPWMNCLYGNQGILYWATDNWTQVGCDPWRKTETYPTGNGDGSLLYPGRDGYGHPVASIRLKMLREGLEDYELLTLLANRLREAASGIGGTALDYRPEKRLFEHAFALIQEEGRNNPLGEDTPYLKYVTQDYRDVETQRDMVINEIEQANAKPLLLVDTIPCDNGYAISGAAVVTGYAETGASVQINGVPAELRENAFRATVPLARGANVIAVSAKDHAGTSKIIQRTIYYRR